MKNQGEPNEYDTKRISGIQHIWYFCIPIQEQEKAGKEEEKGQKLQRPGATLQTASSRTA